MHAWLISQSYHESTWQVDRCWCWNEWFLHRSNLGRDRCTQNWWCYVSHIRYTSCVFNIWSTICEHQCHCLSYKGRLHLTSLESYVVSFHWNNFPSDANSPIVKTVSCTSLYETYDSYLQLITIIMIYQLLLRLNIMLSMTPSYDRCLNSRANRSYNELVCMHH